MIEDRFVTLAYGNGGRYMRELIAGKKREFMQSFIGRRER